VLASSATFHSNWHARRKLLPVWNSCKKIMPPKPEKQETGPERHSEPRVDSGEITATQQWNYCGGKNAAKQKTCQRNDTRTESNDTAKTESVDNR
jgi:hypothetical protein